MAATPAVRVAGRGRGRGSGCGADEDDEVFAVVDGAGAAFRFLSVGGVAATASTDRRCRSDICWAGNGILFATGVAEGSRRPY